MLSNIKCMANDEFVEFCYKTILSRTADDQGKNYYVESLNQGRLNREDVLLTLLISNEFNNKNVCKEFVPPGHFYSVIPSMEDIQEYLRGFTHNDQVLGISLNEENQLKLLKEFKRFYLECPFPEEKSNQYRFNFLNPLYAYTDALILYSMIRYFKPKRIIEIGSGYSSCVMLDTNDHFLNGQIDIEFIEPFTDLLFSLIRKDDNKHNIIPTRLQDVDIGKFEKLMSNDILFIDSTHVSKLLSDVNRIFFEIIPVLQKGVIIHFHDIFWPFEYPKAWIREGRAWNESYILRAFLEFNQCFEILFFADYMHAKYSGWFKENMPLCLRNTGGNIWLRRIG